MIFKVKGEFNGAHVKAKLFCGEQQGSLANCGDFCMREDEYRAFCATLMKGSYVRPNGYIKVEIEGHLSKTEPLEDEDI